MHIIIRTLSLYYSCNYHLHCKRSLVLWSILPLEKGQQNGKKILLYYPYNHKHLKIFTLRITSILNIYIKNREYSILQVQASSSFLHKYYGNFLLLHCQTGLPYSSQEKLPNTPNMRTRKKIFIVILTLLKSFVCSDE